MSFRAILLLVCTKLYASVLGKYDFCRDKCNPGRTEAFACHCLPAPDCHIPESVDWPHFRRAILNAHNDHRNRFATGPTPTEIEHGFTSATNMMALSYDYDLEYTARCLAKRCLYERSCAITQHGESGQNIFVSARQFHSHAAIAKATMHEWYIKEIRNINADGVEQLKSGFTPTHYGFNGTIEHFTQVVWGATRLVGCWYAHGPITAYQNRGEMTTKPLNGMQFVLVCNYAPSGNVKGQPVFEEGKPGKCAPGFSYNGKYEGLCGEDQLPDPPSPHEKYGYEDPVSGGGSFKYLSRFCAFFLVVGSIFRLIM